MKINKTLIFSTLPALGSLISCTSEEEQEQPNIIYIMADDHAFQALSCYEDHLIETPNLDRIANEGMLFENSFVTNSISAPSRAVLMTGKHCHINGKIDNHNVFDVTQKSFPRLLRGAGYQTAMVGKWHLKNLPYKDDYDYWKILPGQGNYYNPTFINMDSTKQRDTGYVTEIITDYALEWLKEREEGKPFCLMLHHKAPHRNWMPDLKHLNLFKNDTFPLPHNFFDDYEGRRAAQEQEQSIFYDMTVEYDLKMTGVEDTIGPGWSHRSWMHILDRMTEKQKEKWHEHYRPIKEKYEKATFDKKSLARWKYQRYMRDYLRCIVSIDENVGRVLDYIDKEGLTENTMIVYTSDQGFYLGEHGWFDKRFMYRESLRMPLMIKYPKMIKSGSKCEAMVQNLDFAPTLLDVAGVTVPEDMQGESMVPLFKEKESPLDWRTSIYYHYYEYPSVHMVKRHYGIRTEKYKLIHFYYDIDTWELYDLEKDPYEMNNLINDPEYQDVIDRLKEELQQLRDKYGDSEELTQKFLQQKLEALEKKKKEK